jgi:hypothetical protein
MISVSVLGSTGSIGTSTLDVIRRHPERFRLFALAANSSVDALCEQVLEFRPAFAVLVDPVSAAALRERLATTGIDTEVLDGEAALDMVASHPDVDAVMAAIVGAAGLRSAWAAAAAGKRVMLANKESLVVAGQLFMDAVDAAVGSQRKEAKALGMAPDDIECAGADRAGRPEQGNVDHAASPARESAATKTGLLETRLSMRSQIPPWPGSSLPLSFSPARRLTMLSKRSPPTETRAVTRAMPAASASAVTEEYPR